LLRSRALPALALAAWLPGCGFGGSSSSGDGSLQFTSPAPFEPTAGAWRTWLVTDVTALRAPEPPGAGSATTAAELADLHARAAARDGAATANVDLWNEGACKQWDELHRALIVLRGGPPPKHARGLALVSVAMYDAMVVAFDSKYEWLRARPNVVDPTLSIHGPQEDSPSYPSARAAISAAAAAVLRSLFPMPADLATIDAKLADAVDADLDSGTHYQSDIDAGLSIGDAVAALALARKASDHGDDPQPAYAPSGLPGRWAPAPGAPMTPPVLAGWGLVDTWVLPDGTAIRPPPPPTYGGNLWTAQVQDVYDVSQTLTPERQAIALFWADGAGTVTPPGHWNQIAVDTAVAHGLSDVRTARMLALLGVAQHDAFVACWECKYFYDCARPITEIRATIDGGWTSFITTPHFPSYPSGHSTTSGAASQVLSYVFPDVAIDFAVMAGEAKDSRLYGGIHYRFDNDTGLDMGRIIGGLVVELGSADGSD
jgi:membrane-associated phospholipid phosphatase